MRIFHMIALASFLLPIGGQSHASVITQDTRYTASGPSKASAFLTTFDSLTPGTGTNGYGVTNGIADWTGLSNLYGSHSNVATDMSAQFAVTSADAGNWGFQVGGDGGFGGALFLDGVLIGSIMSNFDITPAVTVSSIAVAAGDHTLSWVTFEDCCDGATNQGQFKAPGAATYTTFAAADGLGATLPIPGPGSLPVLATMLLGLIGVTTTRRGRSPR